MTFGTRLKTARKAAKMTQKELARRVGMTQPTLSDLENGNSQGTSSVVALAYALRVTPSWLAEGKGAMEAVSVEHVFPKSLLGDNVSDAENLLFISADHNRLMGAVETARQNHAISNESANTIRLLIAAEQTGLPEEQLTPVRNLLEALIVAKRPESAFNQKIGASKADAKSVSDRAVTAAIEGGIPGADKGLSEHERSRGRAKRHGS
jgi:transcriptional regulator with XRE-family HTH domain